ncbi:tRNA glutamyl-Q(34) synthetase GluQRS [Roseibacillus ishigakijimensis]|uniref:tRNA glutamyl-Q(34) synthetase GluQRS n=1 Tax=Roseibacillus ishigakijimensis TaxID=454146 RepID=A0A934RMZ5_9BACT|nr:tRNA glutamyl-Q(34) synthetase GluQRS [Roseibacillus ishigakijimensis]MBK1833755.1 tRNA glutamyl-Q(34) synthetase GluQRS [Roseibacillus ishigakijimensis]
MRTRFAPSPTGRLHLGHAYSAWLAWERAVQQGGEFLLRFEDIDHTRVRPEFYEGIEEDLRWLGLQWPQPAWRQLDRLAAYEEALARLRERGVLYPCFCTRRELAASAPQQGDGAQLYPGTCRGLSAEERAAREAAGRGWAWRMDMARAADLVGPLTFQEESRGLVRVRPTLLGDPVLARKDIATSYHLAVVVDDAAQEVSEVVRGEDLLESTHIHRVLQVLLELPEPRYFHHPLVVDEGGQRLAKRHDALAIATLREAGVSPEEVLRQARLNVRRSA